MLDRLFEFQHQRRQMVRVRRVTDPPDQLARLFMLGFGFADLFFALVQPLGEDREKFRRQMRVETARAIPSTRMNAPGRVNSPTERQRPTSIGATNYRRTII